MTTASNSINTDSIDTTTSGILTIGGVATNVNLKDTTTQALTVTGITTCNITTTTIIPSYPDISNQPSISAEQKGYQLFSTVTSTFSSNTSIAQSGVYRVVYVSGTSGPTVSVSLPIGVWQISYTLRIISDSNSNPTTYMTTFATLTTPVTLDGVNYMKYLGIQALPCQITNTNGTVTNRPAFSGNSIISNNVAGNVVTLQFMLRFATSPLKVWGTQSSVVNTFLIATRIA